MADVADEVAGASALTRGDLLKRGTAAAFAVSMFGGLTDSALGVYGPLKYAHKQLSGELRIMTWAHFVPDYDRWLDGTYVKQWGAENDVDVKVDHINNALLYSTGASEVAAQSGHDLFWFISPPSSFQKQTVPVTDLVQEVSKKVGPMSRVARKSVVQPEDEAVLRLPRDVRARSRPVQAQPPAGGRRQPPDVGRPPEGGREAEADRASGRPRHVERDRLQHDADVAPLLLRRLHPERGEPHRHRAGKEPQGRDPGAPGDARHLPERDVGRGLRVDRGVEQPGVPRRPALGRAERDLDRPLGGGLRERGAVGRHLARLDPARSRDAHGERARDGRLRDLEVREEQGSGEEVPRRPAARLPRALHPEQVLQLPALDRLDPGRLQGDPRAHGPGHAQAEGQVHGPDHDRREVHDEPGASRQHDPGDGRDLQHVPDPADVRRGGAGQVEPCRCGLGLRAKAQGIYRKWRNQKLV